MLLRYNLEANSSLGLKTLLLYFIPWLLAYISVFCLLPAISWVIYALFCIQAQFLLQSLLWWNAGFKYQIFISLLSRINHKDYEMLCEISFGQ